MAKKKRDSLDSFSGFVYNVNTSEEKSMDTQLEIKSTDQIENTKTKGRPKEKREIKKRISLAVLPSLYENAQKIAYVDRKSISEIVSILLQEYVEKNKDKVEEYDKIKNKQ